MKIITRDEEARHLLAGLLKRSPGKVNPDKVLIAIKRNFEGKDISTLSYADILALIPKRPPHWFNEFKWITLSCDACQGKCEAVIEVTPDNGQQYDEYIPATCICFDCAREAAAMAADNGPGGQRENKLCQGT
jgi:hypothetical protein